MKRILITGASSGLGRSMAFFLSRKGFQVAGTTRNPKRLPPELQDQTAVRYVAMDVTSIGSVETGVSEALSFLGGLDVLVNNAGISHLGPFESISDESAREYVETNILGVARVIRAAIPTMRTQSNGLIINVGSLAGRMGIPFQAYYAATKFALEGLTESIRMELEPLGIRATIVEPGNFVTEIAQNRQVVSQIPAAYRPHFDPARAKIEGSLHEGDDPQIMAERVLAIIQSEKPRLRYSVGRGAALIDFLAKHLPDFIFERILKGYYGIN